MDTVDKVIGLNFLYRIFFHNWNKKRKFSQHDHD